MVVAYWCEWSLLWVFTKERGKDQMVSRPLKDLKKKSKFYLKMLTNYITYFNTATTNSFYLYNQLDEWPRIAGPNMWPFFGRLFLKCLYSTMDYLFLISWALFWTSCFSSMWVILEWSSGMYHSSFYDDISIK